MESGKLRSVDQIYWKDGHMAKWNMDDR